MGGNLKRFVDTWNEEIRKIENALINNNTHCSIYNQFVMGRIILKTNMRRFERTEDMFIELDLLESKLIRALGIARTNFKLQNRSSKVRIIESVAGIIRGVLKLKC